MTSYRRLINVETTSCGYWDNSTFAYNSCNIISRCNCKENLQLPHWIIRTGDLKPEISIKPCLVCNDKSNFTIIRHHTAMVSLLLKNQK